jgi:hypothetical protein
MKTLKVTRPLIDPGAVVAWAEANLSPDMLSPRRVDPSRLHVTLAYSRAALDWSLLTPDVSDLIVPASSARSVAVLGGGALALLFDDERLAGRHAEIRLAGASWDYPVYHPHITIAWDAGVDPAGVSPFTGPLMFGAERFGQTKSF